MAQYGQRVAVRLPVMVVWPPQFWHLLLVGELVTRALPGAGLERGHRLAQVLLDDLVVLVLDDLLHVAAVWAAELLLRDVELELATALPAGVGPGLLGVVEQRPLALRFVRERGRLVVVRGHGVRPRAPAGAAGPNPPWGVVVAAEA